MRLLKPLLAVSLVIFVGYALYGWQTRASHWRERLEASPTLTLYSLQPPWYQTKKLEPQIDGIRIIGRTKISGRDRDVVLSAVKAAWRTDDAQQGAACLFSPCVALESEDGSTHVSLCFSCGDGFAGVSGQSQAFLIYPRGDAQGKESEDKLNAILRRAHVPLAKPSDE